MSFLFWLIILCCVAAYMAVVGDTVLKIKAQLNTILARLPVPSRKQDVGTQTDDSL